MEFNMTLSGVSNTALTQSQVSQQKAEKNKSDLSSADNDSGKQFDDNVTLSKSEKSASPSRVIDESEAEKLLPRILKSIVASSKIAVTAQANISPQTAQGFLADTENVMSAY
jgi:hypothetical protein